MKMSSDKEYSSDYRFIYRKVMINLKSIAIILFFVSFGLLNDLNKNLKNDGDYGLVEHYSKM